MHVRAAFKGAIREYSSPPDERKQDRQRADSPPEKQIIFSSDNSSDDHVMRACPYAGDAYAGKRRGFDAFSS